MGFSSFLCSKSNQSIPAYPYAGLPAILSDVKVLFSDDSSIEGLYDGYMNVNGIDIWDYLRARGLRNDTNDCFDDLYSHVRIVRLMDYCGEKFSDLGILKDCPDQGYFYEFETRASLLQSIFKSQKKVPKPIKKRTYHFYSDSGHGWLKVPLKDIIKLGIQDKISGCSYERGTFVYLEEDCDAQIFLEALGKDWKDKVIIKESWTNKRSRIRAYASYSAPKSSYIDSRYIDDNASIEN